MSDAERQARISELLRLRLLVTDLLETIDGRLEELRYGPVPVGCRYSRASETKLKRSSTVTGKPFYYDGSISRDLIVYPTDRDGVKRSGTRVRIRSEVIDFIRGEIRKAGEIAMGACRDSPIPGSLGERLRQRHKSPQLLSYLIPLLTKEDFCTYFKVGRRYMVCYEGPRRR